MGPTDRSAAHSEHKGELLEILQLVKQDAHREPLLRRFPTRHSSSVFSYLKGDWNENHTVGHAIRQIHDFYGWMARDAYHRGHCAGTLYRTAQYLRHSRIERNGTKSAARNIHIEHTVPVAVLVAALTFRHKERPFSNALDLHKYLIARSVCVAFSHEEEVWLRGAQIPGSTNAAFSNDKEDKGKQLNRFPFRRYTPLVEYAKKKKKEFRIVNVVTNEEICLNTYSFDDHVKSLKAASRMAGEEGGISLYDLDLFDRSHNRNL